jgi:hypothetical protein
MSISSITNGVPVQSLIQRTMAAADLDKNGQLSADEFSSFFTTLLDGLSGKGAAGATGNALSSTNGLSALGTTSDAQTFAPVPGFDLNKLRNLDHVNDKYTPAVRVFSRGLADLGLDAVKSRGNLPPMVDYAKQNGFENAKTVSDDQIDFGDGHGSIDCITSDGTWWFQNQK